MANKTKKVDLKKVNKAKVVEIVKDTFTMVEGIEILNGENFGMTSGTLIARLKECDVQIKFITPKAGVDHYEEVVEEVEA